jgi:hypothetical protein
MKKERVFILKVSVVLAVASLVISAAVWGVIIWQLGKPYQMPFLTSLQTARATGVFAGRYLLTAVLIFIVAWFPVRSWLIRRDAGPDGTR